MGVKLFARSRYGLAPTPAAHELALHAEAMEAAADAFRRAASGEADETGGTIRLTASNMVGAEVLPPILASFHRKHPNIAIELALSNRNQHLSRREADIAIRMMRPTQKSLTVKRIGAVHIHLYGHRRYLARRGMPRGIEELAHQAIIGCDRDSSAFRSMAADELPVSRDGFALRTDDELAQLNALRAGFGIGGAQDGIAARDNNLVPVLSSQIAFRLEMWLVMHEDLRSSRLMRLLFDHLVVHLKNYAAIKL
jgi:DNA-binding transcriptional LysR family regulator